VNLSTLMLET